MLAPLLGGLFIGVLSALPIVNLGNCCCLWIVSGGFLAAYVVAVNEPGALSLSRGAAVGALAGVVGAVVWLFTSSLLDVVLGPYERRLLGEAVRAAREMPPGARAWLESLSDGVGRALMFGVVLLVGVPVASLGGLLGAAYYRPDVPPALGGPVVPPPLP